MIPPSKLAAATLVAVVMWAVIIVAALRLIGG